MGHLRLVAVVVAVAGVGDVAALVVVNAAKVGVAGVAAAAVALDVVQTGSLMQDPKQS